MTVKLRAIAFAALASLALLSSPVRAQTTAGDADAAELQAIIKDDLTPLGQKAQAAIDMATSDPAQACQLAKSAVDMAGDARQRFTTLYGKMSGEGVDVSSLADMKARLDLAPDKMAQLAQSICSGQFAAYENDPATKDMTRIGVFMKAYTDDAMAAATARDGGDTPTACQKTRDGEKQLDALTAYLIDLRKRRTFTAEEVQALDNLDKQIAGFRATSEDVLKSCPAS
jgi:hypothetical protein